MHMLLRRFRMDKELIDEKDRTYVEEGIITNSDNEY